MQKFFKVIRNISGHGFSIGELIRREETHYNDDNVYRCKSLTRPNQIWLISDSEVSIIDKPKYANILNETNYRKLLSSGMFWEMHPELTGDFEEDKEVLFSDISPESTIF